MKTSHVKKIVIHSAICQDIGAMKIDKGSIVDATAINTADFVKEVKMGRGSLSLPTC